MKTKTMKIILPVLTIICFTSCGQIVDKANGTENIDSIKTKAEIKNIEISAEILGEIKNYYQKEYGKGARIEEANTDSTIEITYHSIPKAKDDYDGFLIGITIAKNNSKILYSADPVISGDLNNDKINDLVVSVHTEGGGGGSNGIWWNDIFVFVNQNGKFILTTIKKDTELSDCNDGHFLIHKIENGYLIGNSSCYAEDDARCCPSLNYLTKSNLQKDKLMFVSKTKIK